MNILKNFEAVFVVALGVAASASFLAQPPDALDAVAASASASVATPSKMAVVTVAGQAHERQEKQRSLEDERRLAKRHASAAALIAGSRYVR